MLPRRATLASALGLVAAAAEDASFPSRPVRLIYPFVPGVEDELARRVAKVAREGLGQPIVLENKPGANTMIGAEAAAGARRTAIP